MSTPAWQNRESLAAIRGALTGADRTAALALYLTLSEVAAAGTAALEDAAQLAGLSEADCARIVEALRGIGLLAADGTLVQ